MTFSSFQKKAEHLTGTRGWREGNFLLVLAPVSIFAKINFKRKYIYIFKTLPELRLPWNTEQAGGVPLPVDAHLPKEKIPPCQ